MRRNFGFVNAYLKAGLVLMGIGFPLLLASIFGLDDGRRWLLSVGFALSFCGALVWGIGRLVQVIKYLRSLP
ncbi:hypothetical protein [Stenotrophomonas maltophilia]|uniref:hypothetical protein n=1 Tax=Stenotrophomonas maltophilia TaxID=40324 RepID=UPI0015DD349F|nr:hypothetical protein [Stenotrophomonas maltophilia]QDL29077.1 hypothetical protein EGM71_15480 [Stenotrophomonas maltophilia]